MHIMAMLMSMPPCPEPLPCSESEWVLVPTAKPCTPTATESGLAGGAVMDADVITVPGTISVPWTP